MRPLLLDLFCGAGGAAKGYHDAGFDVVGVDIDGSLAARYPFEFHEGDAMTWPLDGFAAIHASPPCHGHSVLNAVNKTDYGTEWMLGATIERLTAHGTPFVVENVPSPSARRHMPGALTLCGSEFGLTTTTAKHGRVWLRRHRLFLSNVDLWGAGGCNCYGKVAVPVYGHGAGGNGVRMRGAGVAQAARDVMGIDWMTRDQLDEAIPPAYTRFIGEQLMAAVRERAA